MYKKQNPEIWFKIYAQELEWRLFGRCAQAYRTLRLVHLPWL